jgi:photosystem II stability/assembly factor-like uncharacterized protein
MLASFAAGALLLAACGGGDAAPSASAADLVHVHGLAESENGLYVATHLGLFEVVGDEITPVGDATHDLMGFTVAGPGDLVASGHPDLRVENLLVDGKPPLLGLVQSKDGQTWAPMSLLGEVDFHSLEAAHDRIYGFDSTSSRFMVSDDRKTWETRSKDAPIIDFAVSPDDADTIVATTPNGMTRSTDGGRTWEEAVAGQFVYVDWDSKGLYAVTAQRQLSRSSDGGRTWTDGATLPGDPEALLVAQEGIYVAVAEQGIVRSTDEGKTFEVIVNTSDA